MPENLNTEDDQLSTINHIGPVDRENQSVAKLPHKSKIIHNVSFQ